MSYIAALTYQGKFLIIMPLARNFNLEIFLHAGKLPHEIYSHRFEEKYDSKEAFPWLRKERVVQKAMIEEMSQIAGALAWLHNGLDIAQEDKLFVAHMDLKPENILIYGDPRNVNTPVGRWTLTDFGISAFYRDPKAPLNGLQNRQTRSSFEVVDVSSDQVHGGYGPYRSPEASLTGKHFDPRCCDLWSYGGILLDILAFAMHNDLGVQKLREARRRDLCDCFFSASFPSARKKTKDNVNMFQLKGSIIGWRDEVLDQSDSKWINMCLKLAFDRCLIIDHQKRWPMSKIKEELSNIHQQILSPGGFSNIPSNHITRGSRHHFGTNRSITKMGKFGGMKAFSMFRSRSEPNDLQAKSGYSNGEEHWDPQCTPRSKSIVPLKSSSSTLDNSLHIERTNEVHCEACEVLILTVLKVLGETNATSLKICGTSFSLVRSARAQIAIEAARTLFMMGLMRRSLILWYPI